MEFTVVFHRPRHSDCSSLDEDCTSVLTMRVLHKKQGSSEVGQRISTETAKLGLVLYSTSINITFACCMDYDVDTHT